MSIILKSNILLIHNSHRLCSLSVWQSKWNGHDVNLVLPTISQLWFLILKPEYLNDDFWNHIQNLSEEKKNWILEKYKFNILEKTKGNIFSHYITLQVCQFLCYIWKQFVKTYYYVKTDISGDKIQEK